jgi:hypothetical protein
MFVCAAHSRTIRDRAQKYAKRRLGKALRLNAGADVSAAMTRNHNED